MSESTDRLARFVDECRCGTGVDDRLAELDAIGERAAPPDEDRRALSALDNETRYGLLRALVAADRDLCVCELHPLFGVGESAVSHALTELREAGLVERRQEGRWHYYAPTERAERLVAALDAIREGDGPRVTGDASAGPEGDG